MSQLRERQQAETYKLILESARALFNELGFEKTTMRLVAARAGIGLGTTYKYFSQKNGLLAAAFFDDLNMTMKSAFKSLPGNLSLKEELLHIAGRFYTFYAIRPLLSKTYLTQLSLLDPDWLEKIVGLDESYLMRVAQLIERVKKRGEIIENVDAHLVATAFHSHYLYVLAIHMALNNFEPETMLGTLGSLLDLLLTGISPVRDLS